MSSLNARSVLLTVANLFALFVVIGFCAQGLLNDTVSSKDRTPVASVVTLEEPQAAAVPLIRSSERQTRHKPKSTKGSKGSAEEIDCIPLYPTMSPVKSTKGSKGSERRLSSSTKGKGSTAAPTVSSAPVSKAKCWLSVPSNCPFPAFSLTRVSRSFFYATVLLLFGCPKCHSYCIERSFRLVGSYLRLECKGKL